MMSHRMQHQPIPDTDPLHALGSEGTIPPDVYEHPEWYSFGEWTPVCAAIIRQVRGRPLAEVLVYRAVPPGATMINPGDWVTTHLGYARQHAVQTDDPADDWPVLVAAVRADQVRSGGSDIVEWGYFGEPVSGRIVPATMQAVR